MADELRGRLLDHIRAEGLFAQPGLALLAVSGGADSLALLDLVHGLATELNLTLAVVHVDHGIVPGSAQVAERVRSVATRYRVPCEVRTLALGPGTSETRARRERYHILRAVQDEMSARYLVTAHHADDQVETVLLRLLKGSGVAGLAAIPSVGPHGLVRPLLGFRRHELAARAAAAGLPVFEDPANADPRGERARVRHELLPLLRDRFGSRVEQRLLRLADHAARERRAWSEVLGAIPQLAVRREPGSISLTREPLRHCPDDLARVVLRAAALEVGCVVGPARAGRLLRFVREGASGRSAQLGGPWVAELAFDRLRIRRCRSAVLPSSASWGETESGSLTWHDWEITWRPAAAGPLERGGYLTWVTPGPGEVRGPRRGDRLRPLGGVGRRPLRRLFMEARVPAGDRAAHPVLVRGGEIVWVPGVCRAQGAAPEPGARALQLEARRVGEAGRTR